MQTDSTRNPSLVARPTLLRVAHRGGAGLAPENTMAAFRQALELGVDAVELDVHLSRDGVPVVIHDPSLARTTDGSGEVGEWTVAELSRLNAAARYFGPWTGERQKIPLLEEVLAEIRGRLSVQVEIKVRQDGNRYPGIEEKVIDLLRQNGMIDQAIILSFDFPTLQKVKELEPALATCALIGAKYLTQIGVRGPEAVAEEIASLKADYAGVDERWYSSELLEALRQRGIRVGVWTVNDEDRMRYFLNQRVAFITSDRPDLLKRIQ
ncbi:MAG: glycerophosphodiester phosphodiesterase [Spirochaetales bacterium]